MANVTDIAIRQTQVASSNSLNPYNPKTPSTALTTSAYSTKDHRFVRQTSEIEVAGENLRRSLDYHVSKIFNKFVESIHSWFYGPQPDLSELSRCKINFEQFKAHSQLEETYAMKLNPLLGQAIETENPNTIKQMAGEIRKYLKSISYQNQEEAVERIDRLVQISCLEIDRLDTRAKYEVIRFQLLREVFGEKSEREFRTKRETSVASAGPSIPINVNATSISRPKTTGATNELLVTSSYRDYSNPYGVTCNSASSEGFINNPYNVMASPESFDSTLDCDQSNNCLVAVASNNANTSYPNVYGTFFVPANESSFASIISQWTIQNATSTRMANIFGRIINGEYALLMWDEPTLKTVRTASVLLNGTYSLQAPLVNATNPKYTLIDTSSMVTAYKDLNNFVAIQKMQYGLSGATLTGNAFPIAGSTDPFFLFKLDDDRLAVAFSKASGGSSFAVFSISDIQQALEVHEYTDLTLKSLHCKGQLCIMLGKDASNNIKLQPFYMFNPVMLGSQVGITGSESYTDSDVSIYGQDGPAYNIGVFSTTSTGVVLDRFSAIVEEPVPVSPPVTTPISAPTPVLAPVSPPNGVSGNVDPNCFQNSNTAPLDCVLIDLGPDVKIIQLTTVGFELSYTNGTTISTGTFIPISDKPFVTVTHDGKTPVTDLGFKLCNEDKSICSTTTPLTVTTRVDGLSPGALGGLIGGIIAFVTAGAVTFYCLIVKPGRDKHKERNEKDRILRENYAKAQNRV